MSEITIHQGTTTAHLHEVHYHLPDGFLEGGAAQGESPAITAEADQPLTDGPAEIRYNGKTLAVTLEVFLSDDDAEDEDDDAAPFDPDEEDLDEYRSVCDLGLRPDKGKLVQLAFNLGLLEGFSREHQKALLEKAD